MYAIIEDGSRQYRVGVGDTIEVDRRDLPEGQDAIEFDRVLLVGQGSDVKVGQPFVPGACVRATVDGEVKAPKIDVVKFKRRKGYRVKQGHRQKYLRVTVSDINAG
jgi:large subunit ribosomal protein L21